MHTPGTQLWCKGPQTLHRLHTAPKCQTTGTGSVIADGWVPPGEAVLSSQVLLCTALGSGLPRLPHKPVAAAHRKGCVL